MKPKNILKKYEALKEKLKAKLFGQDKAVDKLMGALVHLDLSPIKQPFKGLFTFLGPHNSGKVYLATLLEQECDDFEGIKIIDMAEFTDPSDQKNS